MWWAGCANKYAMTGNKVDVVKEKGAGTCQKPRGTPNHVRVLKREMAQILLARLLQESG